MLRKWLQVTHHFQSSSFGCFIAWHTRAMLVRTVWGKITAASRVNEVKKEKETKNKIINETKRSSDKQI